MANVFIMIKNNTFIPNTITSKLVEYCIDYDYILIGVNNFGKFYIYQYRGKEKYIELFVKQCKKVFSKYKYFSILYKEQEKLQKLSENDITFIQDIELMKYKEYNKKIVTSILKNRLLFFLSSCYKKDKKYYFTVYYKSFIQGIPKKIVYECYCMVENNMISIYSNSMVVLHNIELWFHRLIQLYSKI